jgi:hypothetical protein
MFLKVGRIIVREPPPPYSANAEARGDPLPRPMNLPRKHRMQSMRYFSYSIARTACECCTDEWGRGHRQVVPSGGASGPAPPVFLLRPREATCSRRERDGVHLHLEFSPHVIEGYIFLLNPRVAILHIVEMFYDGFERISQES